MTDFIVEIFLSTCDNGTSREYQEDVDRDWIKVVSGAKTETFDRYTPWELTQKWAKVQVTSDDKCTNPQKVITSEKCAENKKE